MELPEISLDGGNASPFVSRAGETVRKPWLPSTDSVQRLLGHLRDRVGDLVPEPLGRDELGRQVLEFAPGTEAMVELPVTATDAERIGADIRVIHSAAAAFARRDSDLWATAMRRPGDEIISHNDLAPWNLIRSSQRWAFIDWDGAGPTTRVADLAYAVRAFAQLDQFHHLEEALPLVRAILDGYEASVEDRAAVLPAMIERTEAMRDLLLGSITTGTQPWASMAIDGHGEYWTAAAAYLREHATTIAAAVR
ncbi:MAG: phosphotransferase [Microbacteriaceae bacterium]|nr:phosphotransferase [Microbacteriaceae bacterium]